MSYPAADLVTDRAAIVVQDRAVVPFTSWLADTLRRCVETERTMQVVTPGDARITRPLRFVLRPPSAHWVVRTDHGYYDGLSGVELTWNGTAFVPDVNDGGAGRLADAFMRTPDGLGDILALNILVHHPKPDRMVLGAVVQGLSAVLCGSPPSGWGAAEPVTEPWDPSQLTAAIKKRGGRRTSVVVHSSPAAGATRTGFAVLDIASVDGAVEESITLAIGSADEDGLAVDGLPALVGRLADRYPLESLIATREPGRPDLTVGPQWAGAPVPVGMAVGPGPVRLIGRSRAFDPPGVAATIVGGTEPAVWYPLDDAGPSEAYERLQQLLRHLGIEPFGAGPVPSQR